MRALAGRRGREAGENRGSGPTGGKRRGSRLDRLGGQQSSAGGAWTRAIGSEASPGARAEARINAARSACGHQLAGRPVPGMRVAARLRPRPSLPQWRGGPRASPLRARPLLAGEPRAEDASQRCLRRAQARLGGAARRVENYALRPPLATTRRGVSVTRTPVPPPPRCGRAHGCQGARQRRPCDE